MNSLKFFKVVRDRGNKILANAIRNDNLYELELAKNCIEACSM